MKYTLDLLPLRAFQGRGTPVGGRSLRLHGGDGGWYNPNTGVDSGDYGYSYEPSPWSPPPEPAPAPWSPPPEAAPEPAPAPWSPPPAPAPAPWSPPPAPAPAPAPANQWEQTVNDIYQQTFGRQADASGMATFTALLNQGLTGEQMREALRTSEEGQSYGLSPAPTPVPPLTAANWEFQPPSYDDFGGTSPASWANTITGERRDLATPTNIQTVRDEVGNVSYVNADTGAAIDTKQLDKNITGYDKEITSLFQDLLGRTPSASEVASYNQQIQSGAADLSELVKGVTVSPEFLQAKMPFLDPNADVNTKFEQGVRGFDAKGLVRGGALEGLPTHYFDPQTGKLAAWFGTSGGPSGTDFYTWHTAEELKAPGAELRLAEESKRDVGAEWRDLGRGALKVGATVLGGYLAGPAAGLAEAGTAGAGAVAGGDIGAFLAADAAASAGSVGINWGAAAAAAAKSAAINAAVTAAQGGNIGDVLKAGALGAVSGGAGVAGAELLGGGALAQIGSQTAVATAIAAATGKDPMQAALSGALTATLANVVPASTSDILNGAGITDPSIQKAINSAISSSVITAIRGGDVGTAAIMGAVNSGLTSVAGMIDNTQVVQDLKASLKDTISSTVDTIKYELGATNAQALPVEGSNRANVGTELAIPMQPDVVNSVFQQDAQDVMNRNVPPPLVQAAIDQNTPAAVANITTPPLIQAAIDQNTPTTVADVVIPPLIQQATGQADADAIYNQLVANAANSTVGAPLTSLAGATTSDVNPVAVDTTNPESTVTLNVNGTPDTRTVGEILDLYKEVVNPSATVDTPAFQDMLTKFSVPEPTPEPTPEPELVPPLASTPAVVQDAVDYLQPIQAPVTPQTVSEVVAALEPTPAPETQLPPLIQAAIDQSTPKTVADVVTPPLIQQAINQATDTREIDDLVNIPVAPTTVVTDGNVPTTAPLGVANVLNLPSNAVNLSAEEAAAYGLPPGLYTFSANGQPTPVPTFQPRSDQTVPVNPHDLPALRDITDQATQSDLSALVDEDLNLTPNAFQNTTPEKVDALLNAYINNPESISAVRQDLQPVAPILNVEFDEKIPDVAFLKPELVRPAPQPPLTPEKTPTASASSTSQGNKLPEGALGTGGAGLAGNEGAPGAVSPSSAAALTEAQNIVSDAASADEIPAADIPIATERLVANSEVLDVSPAQAVASGLVTPDGLLTDKGVEKVADATGLSPSDVVALTNGATTSGADTGSGITSTGAGATSGAAAGAALAGTGIGGSTGTNTGGLGTGTGTGVGPGTGTGTGEGLGDGLGLGGGSGSGSGTGTGGAGTGGVKPTVVPTVAQPSYSYSGAGSQGTTVGALPGNLQATFLQGANVDEYNPFENYNVYQQLGSPAPVRAAQGGSPLQLAQLQQGVYNVDPSLYSVLQKRAAPNYFTYGSDSSAGNPTTFAGSQMMGKPMPGIPVIPTGQKAGSDWLYQGSGTNPLAMAGTGIPSLPGGMMAHGGQAHGGEGEHIPEFITGATGHYVRGRGDGQSDDIPAMLADGEYVFDASTVSTLGNGSSDAGAKLLDAFRESLRDHTRSAPADKIPPKASPLEYMKDALQYVGRK